VDIAELAAAAASAHGVQAIGSGQAAFIKKKVREGYGDGAT